LPSVSDVVTQWTERLTQAFSGAGPATGTGQTPPPVSNAAVPPASLSGTGTGPAVGPFVARQHLSGAPGLRSTTDQVRGLVASATATVGTDPGRVATALDGAADTLRAQGLDAATALSTTQTTTALSVQDTVNTAVAPVVQGPVARFVSGLLAAIGITPNTAVTTPVRPLAPQTLLGVLALIRREIEHTFFNKAPQFPTDTISLITEEGEPEIITGLPATDADGDRITYTAPARGAAGGPTNGTVTVVGNQVTYTPDAGYEGTDSFTLTASDAGTGFHLHGLASFFNPQGVHTDTVTVNITVEDSNTAPQLQISDPSAPNANTGAVRLVIVVTDPDGDDISTPPVVTLPANANGTLSAVTQGGPPPGGPPPVGASRTQWVVTYTPDPQDRLDAYSTPGPDTVPVTITVTDGVNASVSHTVPVTIDPVAAAVTDVLYDPANPHNVLAQGNVFTNPATGHLNTVVIREFLNEAGQPTGAVSVLDVNSGEIIGDAYTYGPEARQRDLERVVYSESVVDAAGNVYVVNPDPDATSINVVATDGTISTIELDGAAGALAVNPDGTQVYATIVRPDPANDVDPNDGLDTYAISVQNLTTGATVIAPYTVAHRNIDAPVVTTVLSEVEFDSAGNLYHLRTPSALDGGSLELSPSTITVIEVDGDVRTITLDGLGVDLAVSPDGEHVYAVTVQQDAAGNAFLSVVDVGSGPATVVYTQPYVDAFEDLAVSPDGSRLILTGNEISAATVIDTADNTVIATLPTRGLHATFSEDGNHAYISNPGGATYVISFADNPPTPTTV
jgi:hypothetical protein